MESNRLKYRLVQDSDAEFIYELMNTKAWFQFIGDRGIHSPEDAVKYMKDKMHPDLDVKGFVNHVMVEKSSGALVGTCSVHDRAGVKGMDIGYAILSQFEGMGYATEGAIEMVDLAFNTYQQTQISAITNDDNWGSASVLEKIGFTHQGYVKLPNLDLDLKLYVLNK